MSLGEQLKKIREDAGFTIKDLSDITKIQIKYLERLESEEYDKLPTPVYIRGFIQKWALVCKQNPDKFLMQFYRENKALASGLENEQLADLKLSPFVITLKHIIAGFVILVAVSLGTFFIFQQYIFQTPSKLEIFSPQEFNTISESDNILIEGRVENVQTVTINDEIIQIDDNGEFRHQQHLSPGLNTIAIKAHGSNGDIVETIRQVLKL